MNALLLALVVAAEAAPAADASPPAPATPSPSASEVHAAPAATASADARLLSSQVGLSLGLAGSGVAVPGSRWGDTLVAPGLSLRGVYSGFLVEGALSGGLPVTEGGVTTSVSSVVRVGWVAQSWSLHAGAALQWAQDGRPALQTLPSLRFEKSFGQAGFSAGLFDLSGLVPLHVSAEVNTKLGHFSLGYVPPLGVVGSLDVPLTGNLGLRAQAFAYRLFSAEQALFTLGVTYGGAR